jgi:hypothetical protein
MTVARKHSPYCVALGATVLGGITRQNIVTGTDFRGEPASGELYARILAMQQQQVRAGFSTLACGAALAVAGVTGKNIADLSGGLALYGQKHALGGTREAAGAHRKFAFAAGLLTPTQLSCDHRGDATLALAAALIYNGSNDPVVITDAVSLPTADTDLVRYALGPVTIGGVTLPQKRAVSVDFGIAVATEGADGDQWDTFASVSGIQPTITITGIDLEWFKAAAVPLAGLAGTHANTTVYFRKRDPNGKFVADGTAAHLKITACGVAQVDTPFDGGGSEAATCSVRLQCYYDGTNTPLIVNTASAIT